MRKSAKEMRYIERRPNSSENEDHHRGKMAMDIIYRATDRLVTVSEVLNSFTNTGSAAILVNSGCNHHFRGLTIDNSRA